MMKLKQEETFHDPNMDFVKSFNASSAPNSSINTKPHTNSELPPSKLGFSPPGKKLNKNKNGVLLPPVRKPNFQLRKFGPESASQSFNDLEQIVNVVQTKKKLPRIKDPPLFRSEQDTNNNSSSMQKSFQVKRTKSTTHCPRDHVASASKSRVTSFDSNSQPHVVHSSQKNKRSLSNPGNATRAKNNLANASLSSSMSFHVKKTSSPQSSGSSSSGTASSGSASCGKNHAHGHHQNPAQNEEQAALQKELLRRQIFAQNRLMKMLADREWRIHQMAKENGQFNTNYTASV